MRDKSIKWYITFEDAHRANPLLALRLLIQLSGKWETYWRQKKLVTVWYPNILLSTKNQAWSKNRKSLFL